MDSFEKKLGERTRALRKQFAETLPERLQVLEGQFSRLESVSLEPSYRELHNIAGAAGTFGLMDLHHQVRVLELQLQSWLNGPGSITEDERQAFLESLQNLRFQLEYSV